MVPRGGVGPRPRGKTGKRKSEGLEGDSLPDPAAAGGGAAAPLRLLGPLPLARTALLASGPGIGLLAACAPASPALAAAGELELHRGVGGGQYRRPQKLGHAAYRPPPEATLLHRCTTTRPRDGGRAPLPLSPVLDNFFLSLSLIFSKKLGRVEKDHPTGINLRGSLGFSDQENSRTLTPS